MNRVPCEPNPECKFNKNNSCYQNRHHTYWPRADYRTPLEKNFRAVPEHIETMCRAAHEILHLETEPPAKPTPEMMRIILKGYNEGTQ